jgi:hypothetical protein
MTTRRTVSMLFATLLLAVPLPAAAQGQDCSTLPTSAPKARPCNPQQECLARVQQRVTGPALESARRDCARLPASGTCYGPETSNPQAECLARQGKRR